MKKDDKVNVKKKVVDTSYLKNIEKIKTIRKSLTNSNLTDQEMLEKFDKAVKIMKDVINQVNDFNNLIGSTIQKKLDE